MSQMQTNGTVRPYSPPIHDAHQLPIQPPSELFGRDSELSSVQVALKAGSAVLLAGEFGIGKTSLAAAIAANYAAAPGGVLWLDLLEDDVSMLVARVGRAYGVDTFTPSGQDPSNNMAQVRALLGSNAPLVVLDGWLDLDAVREFIRECASGTPLILSHDQVAAGPWIPVELTLLPLEDRIGLYQQLSQLFDPLFEADIAGLCRFLGGNPLAISLAARLAATADMLPAETLNILPSSSGQDSALVMLSIVVKRLPSSVYAMLLVLSGIYTGTASAELMSDVSSLPVQAIIPLMGQLAARGLAVETLTNDQVLYRLHEAAQEQTRSWLRNNQRLDGMEGRVLQAVLAYVQRHAQPYSAERDQLAVEMQNIVAAAAYATETGKGNALMQLINALGAQAGSLIIERGFQPEFDQMLKLSTLLPGLEITGLNDGEDATQPTQDRPDLPPDSPSATQTREREVREDTQQTAAVEVQDGEQEAEQSVSLTEPPPSEDDTDIPTGRSQATLETWLAEARASGDAHKQAKLLYALGVHFTDQGDRLQALAFYKQSLEMYESLEDSDGMLAALDALAGLAAQLGDAEGALVYATRGVNFARQFQDASRLGRLEARLGDVRMTLGDVPAAIESYSAAAEALRASEDWLSIGLIMAKLGDAFLVQRQFQEAIMMLEQVLVIFDKEQRPEYAGRVLGSIGQAHAALEDWPRAQEYFDRALTLAHEYGDLHSAAAQLAAMGHICRMQQDVAGAIQRYRAALHIAFELDDVDLIAEFSFDLGVMLIDHPATLLMGLQLLEESEDSAPNGEVRRLIARASKRRDRASAAGLDMPPAQASSREFAAGRQSPDPR